MLQTGKGSTPVETCKVSQFPTATPAAFTKHLSRWSTFGDGQGDAGQLPYQPLRCAKHPGGGYAATSTYSSCSVARDQLAASTIPPGSVFLRCAADKRTGGGRSSGSGGTSSQCSPRLTQFWFVLRAGKEEAAGGCLVRAMAAAMAESTVPIEQQKELVWGVSSGGEVMFWGGWEGWGGRIARA